MLSERDVPRSVPENEAWRRDLLAGCQSEAVRREVYGLCVRDVLFWVNSFLWTYNPKLAKKGKQADLPFVTWPYQDKAVRVLDEHLGESDIGIEKSRDMGATWLCLLILLHRWQFHKNQAFMISSRNERLVWAKNDPDSLFWKLEYMIKRQPPFLVGAYEPTKLHLWKPDKKNAIDGAASTADLGRGGRRTAFFLDEFDAWDLSDSHEANAATAPNTDCRLINSTYKSKFGAYRKQMLRDDIVKIRMHWADHPDREGSLGKDESGLWRSKYFKLMCAKLASPVLVARELEINVSEATGQAFPEALLDRLILEHARPPFLTGRVEFDATRPKEPAFLEDEHGPLALWCPVRSDGRLPPGDQYAVGCDISQGTMATPSVASVVNRTTREKVAELATASLSPERFAEAVVLLCRYFGEAFLIWEQNGPGYSFGLKVMDLGYRNVYYRQDELGLSGKVNPSLIPGWNASATNKDVLLRAYLTALSTGTFLNRSKQALDECREYNFGKDGSIENPRARVTDDKSGAKKNHADRVVADALANKGLGDEPEVTLPDPNDPYRLIDNPPPGSLAYRRKMWQDQQRAQSRWETPSAVGSRWDRPPTW